MDSSQVLFAMIIIILIMMVAMPLICNVTGDKNKKEGFDTYFNHDIGAQDVYQAEGYKDITLTDAGLKAKYEWSKKDPNGYTVYDDYYELKKLNEINGDSFGLPNVPEHDTYGYDSKFNKAEYTNYRPSEMASINPIEANFNNQKIRLSQKEY